LVLGKPIDDNTIYLIDEPSAYLDCEQKLIVSKLIKKWIINKNCSAIIVEHDFIMASYLADKIIVFDGVPAKECHCTAPLGMIEGLN
jgi:ATP-binding cassette, sub-family E, member 1